MGCKYCGCALLTLIIGAGVKQIGFNQTTPIKTIWLTDYPPTGSTNLSGMVNYVINDKNNLLDNIRVYRFLNYLFEADGVIYVPTDPYEKTCDAISCTYNESIKHCSVTGP